MNIKKIIANVLLLHIAKGIKFLTEPIARIWTRFLLDPESYSEYEKKLAEVYSQYGNVLYQHIFNKELIKPESPDKFGNRKETMSSVIGKNKVSGMLLPKGKKLDEILDKTEENHCVKSIDYKV